MKMVQVHALYNRTPYRLRVGPAVGNHPPIILKGFEFRKLELPVEVNNTTVTNPEYTKNYKKGSVLFLALKRHALQMNLNYREPQFTRDWFESVTWRVEHISIKESEGWQEQHPTSWFSTKKIP